MVVPEIPTGSTKRSRVDVDDSHAGRRKIPRKETDEWIENYSYKNGDCCKQQRTGCQTLAAIPVVEILKRRSLIRFNGIPDKARKGVYRAFVLGLAQTAFNPSTGCLDQFFCGKVRLCQTAWCELHNISRCINPCHARCMELNRI